MRKFTLHACYFAVAWIALGLPPRLAAAAKWLKVETPDVRIYSDGSKRAITEFAVQYTAFRQAFNELIAPPGHRPGAVTILLFRDKDVMQSYLTKIGGKAQNLVEFTSSVGSKQVFALALEGDVNQALAFAFEGDTSAMLHQVGYFLPLWMSQGTGEVLSSLDLHSDRFEIGESQERFTEPLRDAQFIPWDQFFELSRETQGYKGKKDHFTGIYQAQAWAIMNTVLLHGTDGRQRFAKLAGEVHGRGSDLAAVAALDGLKPEQLDKVIWRATSATNRRFPFDAAKVRAGLVLVPAPEVEVKVQLADLLIGARDPEEAERVLDEAVALAPKSVCVEEALGRRALRQNDREAAAAVFRDAIKAGSVDAQAYLTSAEQRIDEARSQGHDVAGGGGDDIPQAIAEIHRGLELQPGDADAYRLLARALYVAPTVPEKDIDTLTPALADQDRGPPIRLYRALIYQRLDKMDACLADLRLIVADPHARGNVTGQATTFLQRIVFEGDRTEARKLVAAGSFADARAILARANLRTDGSTDADAYAGLKDWVDANEVKAQALALYQQKKWAELRDLAAHYLATNPEGGFAKSAHELERMAAQKLAPRPAPTARHFTPGAPTEVPKGDPYAPHVTFLVGSHRWDTYGPYLFTCSDRIEAIWEKVAKGDLKVPSGARITVTFEENSDGEVTRLLRTKTPPGVAPAVTEECIAAVKAAAPYTSWTHEMVGVLGEKQILMAAFTFR